MFTADQLVAHAVGDYVLQSDWMAQEKVRRSVAALAHVATYGLPFLFLRPSVLALVVIVGTHFVIDRWRLARFVVWTKNFLAPVRWVDDDDSIVWPPDRRLRSAAPPWRRSRATGYDEDRPAWLAVWLMIIADNVMHVVVNGAALAWL
jgi:hypothetical protein